MTKVRFYTDLGQRVGPLFERKTKRFGAKVRTAARAASQDIAEQIEKLGESDIARAGNFGTRWTEGLHVDVTEGGGSIRIAVSHDVPYFSVFEYGKVIHGKPMLWIPMSFAVDAQGVWARDYPAPLFRVDRKKGGAPLLLSAEDKQVKYFGKEFVTIPKKFHISEITREMSRHLPDVYRDYLKAGED